MEIRNEKRVISTCRDSQLKTVLQDVTQADIPTELSERLAEEKRIETVSAFSLLSFFKQSLDQQEFITILRIRDLSELTKLILSRSA